ncbi:MAG: GMC family oxidoreductase N-terminal domain-containing protein [Myxococcota bacterium]|nr:GMC family oxidoreductase N-terminal domain-containing protein [Myxococcota bacterium]
MKPFWTEATGEQNIETDVLIIGAGAGGAFAALTLAEAGIQTIMVEKGFHYSQRHVPADLATAVAHVYEEGGFRTSNGDPPMPIAGGKGLGGSTLVNSAICFQTPRSTLAHWNELSQGAFSDQESFYKVQEQVEEIMRVIDTPDPLLSGNDKAHKKASERLGWIGGNIRRNTPACGGCGRCNAICPIGGKNSVDRELLPRAAAAGAKIYTGAHISSLSINGAQGTLYNRAQEVVGSLNIKAKRIILAGGSIATPSLLLSSGFDANNSQIGHGLHVHPVISTWAVLPEPVYARGATQGHYVDQFADNKILLESNPIIAGAFYQAFPVYGLEAKAFMRKGAHMVSTGALVRDESEGRVYKPNGKANIQYSTNDVDRKRLMEGLYRGAQLWFEGAGAESLSLSLFGGTICRNMDDVRKLLPEDLPSNRLVNYSSHPQASCRIGRACDNNGKLKGYDNIYVMDASVLPSNVGRNPQISVMTVVRILAERFVEAQGKTVKPLLKT